MAARWVKRRKKYYRSSRGAFAWRFGSRLLLVYQTGAWSHKGYPIHIRLIRISRCWRRSLQGNLLFRNPAWYHHICDRVIPCVDDWYFQLSPIWTSIPHYGNYLVFEFFLFSSIEYKLRLLSARVTVTVLVPGLNIRQYYCKCEHWGNQCLRFYHPVYVVHVDESELWRREVIWSTETFDCWKLRYIYVAWTLE